MGCDIHMYVERREGGMWRAIPPPVPSPTAEDAWHGPGGCFMESRCYPHRGPGCAACLGTGRDLQWYSNRNYELFAILSGTVRNRYDFVGIVPEPRGIPIDCSPTVRDYNSWDHSPGWLSLPEILAFDWKQTATHNGVIPMRRSDEPHASGKPTYYEDWRAAQPRTSPKQFCGAISGPGIVTLSMAEADRILAPPLLMPAGPTRYYVRAEWVETYETSAADFLEFVRDYLVPLGAPEDTRIVFGFDS